MSTKHLPRFLNEIGFRWDHRTPEEKVTGKKERKIVMVPLPVVDMLCSLLVNAIGSQLRWIKNAGILQFQLAAAQN